MPRDVVLDIFFAKAMAAEYLMGLEELAAGCEELDRCEEALVAKGLLREYARAVSSGDSAHAKELSEAMGVVAIGKAFEQFNFATGMRDVEVYRDERGRFSRHLNNAKSTRWPDIPKVDKKTEKPTRKKGSNVAMLSDGMDRELRTALQGGPNPATDPNAAAMYREQGQSVAGRIRAINLFQDELMELFGENNKDVVVVLEGEQTGSLPPETATLELDEAIDTKQLPALSGNAKMTFGLRQEASPETRDKYLMFTQLLDSGIRPDVAAEMLGGGGGGGAAGAAGKLEQAMRGYTGQRSSERGARAKQHFAMAGALGDYFLRSGQPQLVAAGTALKNTQKLGEKLSPEHYELAERMNYRFRGMKDNLPRKFSDSMRSAQHRTAEQLFYDKNLDAARWDAIREKMFSAPARAERSLSTDQRTGEVRFDDVPMAIASYLDRDPKFSRRLSPRDYIDQFLNNVAVTALIDELPTDKRAVKLGQQAGFGVPSSGIIIRSDGRAKEMYRGVGEDHYLPFSARALPEMRDGQYVRTRVLGGLTNEDITTLVASGARRATVVSGSGVFTIDLKPNVSAVGRMAQPEVAAMGDRYERIVDQLVDSKLYAVDLPAAKRNELRQEAIKFTNSPPGSAAFQARYDKLEAEARAEAAQMTEEDVQKVTESVDAQLESETFASPQMKARVRETLLAEALENKEAEKVRVLGLNGEGYALALETLRMQYPSIIRRVDYETIGEFVKRRELGGVLNRAEVTLRNAPRAKDESYVEPGKTRSHTKKWRNEPAPVQTAAGRLAEATGAAAGATGAAGAAAASEGGVVSGTAPTSAASTVRQTSDPDAGASVDDLRTQMKNSYEKAQRSAVDMLSMASTGLTLLPGKQAMRDEAAESPEKAQAVWAKEFPSGAGYRSFSGTSAGGVLTNQSAMVNSALSPEGLGGLMSSIYPNGWDKMVGLKGLEDDQAVALSASDPDHVAAGETVKQAADLLASAVLVTNGATVVAAPDGDIDEFKPQFAVNPEYFAFVKKKFASGETGAQLAALDKILGDKTRKDTKQRAAARDGVNDFMKSNPKLTGALLHGGTMGADPYDGLSVLGLLALQESIRTEIEGTDDPDSAGGKLVSAISGKDFAKVPKGDQAAVKKVKSEAFKAYQDAIGAEYARRLLGGGGVGPKVLGTDRIVVSKEQQVLEEFKQLLVLHPPVLLPL